jgi:hypothetical protein
VLLVQGHSKVFDAPVQAMRALMRELKPCGPG